MQKILQSPIEQRFTVPEDKLEKWIAWFNAKGYTVISSNTTKKITTLVVRKMINFY